MLSTVAPPSRHYRSCEEEMLGEYLATHHREMIDAEIALNEGAGGLMRDDGTRVMLNIQAGE